MTKHFSSDFYVTCATVIPVLFLAIAVQGRAFESLAQRTWTYYRDFLGPETGKRGSLVLLAGSIGLQICGVLILVAGAVGEYYALSALYRGVEVQRATVFLSTLLLLAAVVVGPLAAWIQAAYQSGREAAAARAEKRPREG